MKKLFIILLAVFSMMLFAEKIEVVTDCYARVSDSSLEKAGWVKAGSEFEVLEVTGAWHYVNFTGGTVHKGNSGWVWRQLIDGNKIKGKGANVHAKPATSSETIFSVKGGATVKLIKKDVKWYKVGPNKYIFHSNVKKIN